MCAQWLVSWWIIILIVVGFELISKQFAHSMHRLDGAHACLGVEDRRNQGGTGG
jgi:hypothetical protein